MSKFFRFFACSLLVVFIQQAFANQSIEFNTDVLDVKDLSRVDLSRFSQIGFIMPGEYLMTVRVNEIELPEQRIRFLPPENNPKGSVPCVTPDILKQLDLKVSAIRKTVYWHQGQCLDLASLEGVEAHADLGDNSLYLNIPLTYLEYTSDEWDPPSRWNHGIAGVLFDYSINTNVNKISRGDNTWSLSGNGTTGFNAGAWRFRADWQGNRQGNLGNLEWNRYYAYRPIASLQAKFMLGEHSLSSSIFDGFSYLGVSLRSDDNMLPPNLRGYAPEITGVAKTNAKVTVSQQGRILYQGIVPAGPFRIQELNSSISGVLDVKVQEQDETIQTYQVNTASIPYLTRPGLVRYKLAAGKPIDYRHNSEGPVFASGEFSWGVSNGWSLYGGAILSGNTYNSLSTGVGRDLLAFGALSFDATQSYASLPQQGVRSGRSYRLSYSKRFDQYDSQVTFAGYRMSERNFMSMSQFIDARYLDRKSSNSRDMYTVSLNKNFKDLNLSANMNYSHHSYWDRPANDTYSLSLSNYFDIDRFKNINLTLSAFRSVYNNNNNDGMYLSLLIPWGKNGGTLSYGMDNINRTVGYNERLNSNNTYSIKAGLRQGDRAVGSGYLTHYGDANQITVNASYQGGQYSSVGASLQGGLSATAQGAALHRVNAMGDTRMIVDTNGVAGVPVRGYGGITRTNMFGKAVISDVSSYYRNSFSVDVNELADNVEVIRSVVQDTLTEGAIGYRKFGVIGGEKGMAVIKLADGSHPPFGATVSNKEKYQVGIVIDDGKVWLSGMNPSETLAVRWEDNGQCYINLPSQLLPSNNNLLLPCQDK